MASANRKEDEEKEEEEEQEEEEEGCLERKKMGGLPPPHAIQSKLFNCHRVYIGFPILLHNPKLKRLTKNSRVPNVRLLLHSKTIAFRIEKQREILSI
ncbi:hypothetical protein M8J77_010383 [Diaphorina citri]|nr:hypothetical protein M8J77_010383 [Diaphorina citri]